MSFTSSMGSKAWIVATSMAVVEVLKDQGFCRWNYALRSINQHTKIGNDIRSSISQAKRQFLSSFPEMTNNNDSNKNITNKDGNGDFSDDRVTIRKKHKQEALRNVMFMVDMV
ncbi:hypothetical protein MKW92_009746 [Papaver armeniacum]|nr:hypothetical protein MKW92_009746 [Papaver armeniacum]